MKVKKLIKRLLIFFTLIQLFSCGDHQNLSRFDGEKLLFQTLDKKYFSTRKDNNNIVFANNSLPSDWEVFYIKSEKKDTVTIITNDNLFLGYNNEDSILIASPKQYSQQHNFLLKPYKEYFTLTTLDGGNVIVDENNKLKISFSKPAAILKIIPLSQTQNYFLSLNEIDFFRFSWQLLFFILLVYLLLRIFKKKPWMNKLSFYSLFTIGFIWGYVIIHTKNWANNNVITNDVIIYYEYLPAAIIFNDLSFEFSKQLPNDFNGNIWVNSIEEKGNRAPKFTIGLSMVYLPFFLIGHLFANVFNYSVYGYSLPYLLAICIGCWFYAFVGLFYLRKTLLKYFNDVVVSFTLFSVALATNLFHYVTIESGMAHAYSFGLFSLFIWHTIKWYEQKRIKTAIILGLLIGIISLIRPTNVILASVFILFGIVKIENVKQKIQLFLLYKKHIFLIILFAFLIWMPQLIYWKYLTGNWFYFSYGDEGFYFNNPQIINGLFSYRKGWLLYTPLMFFSILGIIFLFKQKSKWTLPIFIFLLLNIYIVYSWWCWWYGGSFGSRPMIDSYALLGIPLAGFFSYFDKKTSYLRSVSLFIIFLTICLNLFQTLQYKTCLHYDSMTKKAYWTNFTTLGWPNNYEQLIRHPNYEKALKGEK